MAKFAILLGSAPEDFRQKKIEDMFDFLDSKRNAGDSIVTFANGISEMMLEMVMDNSIKQLTEISEQKAGHSEFISESTKEMLKQVQHDGKRQVQHDDGMQVHGDSHSDPEQSEREESTNSRHSEAKPKNLFLQKMFRVAQHDVLLLYICTLRPVAESEESFWLGGEEIRRDVILHYQKLAAECGIDMQVIFDFDREMVSEEKLGYEKVDSLSHSDVKIRNK